MVRLKKLVSRNVTPVKYFANIKVYLLGLQYFYVGRNHEQGIPSELRSTLPPAVNINTSTLRTVGAIRNRIWKELKVNDKKTSQDNAGCYENVQLVVCFESDYCSLFYSIIYTCNVNGEVHAWSWFSPQTCSVSVSPSLGKTGETDTSTPVNTRAFHHSPKVCEE